MSSKHSMQLTKIQYKKSQLSKHTVSKPKQKKKERQIEKILDDGSY